MKVMLALQRVELLTLTKWTGFVIYLIPFGKKVCVDEVQVSFSMDKMFANMGSAR